MKTFLSSFAGTLAALVLLALIGGGFAACMSGKKPKIKKGSWLDPDALESRVRETLATSLAESPPGSSSANGKRQTATSRCLFRSSKKSSSGAGLATLPSGS